MVEIVGGGGYDLMLVFGFCLVNCLELLFSVWLFFLFMCVVESGVGCDNGCGGVCFMWCGCGIICGWVLIVYRCGYGMFCGMGMVCYVWWYVGWLWLLCLF